MKQGKGSYLVMLWLLIGSLCLGVLLLLLAPRNARPSESENRMLAGAPVLSKDTLVTGDFFTGVEDFLSDGFFQREKVIDTADEVLGLFDLRTEEQRLIQEAAEIDRQLLEDAGAEWSQSGEMASTEGTASVTVAPTATPTAAPTATQTPTATPTCTPTPEPTPPPTPVPTATPAPSPTASQTVAPTPSVTPSATPVPTPFATMTPAPTATPKVIAPLEAGSTYYLYLIEQDGNKLVNYEYPSENIMTFANSLNYLKGMLPEDGEIHYMQVPVAAVGVRLCVQSARFSGWESTMEDALQSQVVNGVYIHNAPAILNDHLAGGEMDLYYFTDHHWSAKGAWYALEAVMQSRGMPVVGYDEYEHQRKRMGVNDSGREDWIEAMYPLAPVHGVIIKHLDQEKESVLINYQSRNYIAYLNGTETPWRRFDTGYGTDRKALVICDSFGNAFVPYLLPYYDEVHMTDLRRDYFDPEVAGGTFAQLVDYHQIDDIYVILSTSNGINSSNSLTTFWETITQ